jgi:hypothetical protein
MVQGNAVADSEASRARAYVDDGAGGFVSEDARRRDGAVLDFFDVGGADTADGHFDEQFVRADARDGDGLDAEIVWTAIDGGAHGFRDRKHAKNLTTDDTDDTDIFRELNREIRGTR